MVYYGRSNNEHVDLTLALVVEGIPVAFVERAIAGAPAGLGGRSQTVCITRVEEGEASLSYDERRETAATLDVDMLDTDAFDLRALFAAGTRAAAWVSTADANDAADTVVYVNTDAPFSIGQHVYVGAETMTIVDVDPSPYIEVTRGAFGSAAAVGMTGESSDGDAIYLVPPYWRGRRVWLYGYTPQGDETLLGVYIVDEAPRHVGDNQWTLRCAGIVQEYFERSVGVGLQESPIENLLGASPFLPEYDLTTTPPSVVFRLTNKLSVQTSAASGWPSYVMLTRNDSEGTTSIHRLTDHDDLTGDATIAFSPEFNTTRLVSGFDLAGGRCRQIGVVQSPGASSILVALLSSDGQDLSGGNYLPGRPAATSQDFGWRLGAGFTTAEIDVNAFDAITAIPPMTIVIDGERKVTDVLREWCLLTGTAIVSTVDGKIKPVTLAAQRASTARTLGADDVIPEGAVSVEHDESGVYPLVTAHAGYSPITGETHDQINLIDVELAKRYRRTPQRREIELRSVDVWDPRLRAMGNGGWRHPSRYTPASLVTLLNDTMRGDGALARRFVRLSLTHQHLDLRIGDTVIIGTDLPDAYDGLPDFRGSTIAGTTCRVVARRPRYDQARVDVRLEILDRLLHVCPAAVIASVSGTTITLATTGPEVSGTSPTDDLFVDAVVRIVDRSTPANTDVLIVDSITSGTVFEATGAPSFTVEAGVDYLVLDPTNCASGTTVSGYTLAEFATLADDDGLSPVLGAATPDPRWR